MVSFLLLGFTLLLLELFQHLLLSLQLLLHLLNLRLLVGENRVLGLSKHWLWEETHIGYIYTRCLTNHNIKFVAIVQSSARLDNWDVH